MLGCRILVLEGSAESITPDTDCKPQRQWQTTNAYLAVVMHVPELSLETGGMAYHSMSNVAFIRQTLRHLTSKTGKLDIWDHDDRLSERSTLRQRLLGHSIRQIADRYGFVCQTSKVRPSVAACFESIRCMTAVLLKRLPRLLQAMAFTVAMARSSVVAMGFAEKGGWTCIASMPTRLPLRYLRDNRCLRDRRLSSATSPPSRRGHSGSCGAGGFRDVVQKVAGSVADLSDRWKSTDGKVAANIS